MLQKKNYLILAIGTDIGKTFLVENLCKVLPDVDAIKPIASGFRKGDKNSDTAKISAALGKKNFDEITPWRFEKAVSPHLAGKINYSEVKKFCAAKISAAKKQNKFLLIEGAGGVMTPISDKKTFLDLAADLKIPVLLVSANYLGSISHTLCAIEALKSRKISVEKIIINDGIFESETKISDLVRSLEGFSGVETILMKKFLKKPA